jgi:hypothetical protein
MSGDIMRSKETTTALLPAELAGPAADTTSAQIATIVSVSADGTPALQVGAGSPIVPARLAVRVSRHRIETAIAQRQQAVVVFENGDRSRPLIIGFIEALENEGSSEARAEVREAANESQGVAVIEADVDGKRVRVTAQDEIVLQCGSASVTLRRNGRVIVRGTYVETHSEGTNRIKGGQVQIN